MRKFLFRLLKTIDFISVKYVYYFQRGIKLYELEEYEFSLKAFLKFSKLSFKKEDKAFGILNCAFLACKIHDYQSAAEYFSEVIRMADDTEFIRNRLNRISYYGRSEAKFKSGDYKAAREDRIKSAQFTFKDEFKHSNLGNILKELESDITDSLPINFPDEKIKFLVNISQVIKSKYDLIQDFKKRLDKDRRLEIRTRLEKISEFKYEIDDYKGAIVALRRSEKYI